MLTPIILSFQNHVATTSRVPLSIHVFKAACLFSPHQVNSMKANESAVEQTKCSY